MEVKFKKLHPDAVIPSYAKPGDAGLDLVAVNANWSFEYIEYEVGLAVEIPEGYVGLIFPRSSITTYNLILKNSIGVIDSGYRGPIKVRFYQTTGEKRTYSIGDRIAQLVILPYPKIQPIEVGELTQTTRGEGGFGHTGK